MPRILDPDSWRVLVKSVAIFILALVALDLGDTWCDPLVVPEAGLAVNTPKSNQADACAGQCVPDCFCCSTSVPAVHITLVGRPAPTTEVVILHAVHASTGFRNPLDHVPLATL